MEKSFINELNFGQENFFKEKKFKGNNTGRQKIKSMIMSFL